jgi:thiol-disulfide isomerase/thioredoxin
MLGSGAFAGEKASFDTTAFEAAKKAGKPILVEVTAPWCPTCKAQAPILGELRSQPRFKDLVIFTVDFDTEKRVLSGFKVQMQSTLIVFKGGTEVGRSTGDTQKASIDALLSKAL